MSVSGPADLDLVDALARLQLEARRLHCEIVIQPVGDDLLGLLNLVGLDQALPVEVRGEPETLEQGGVEEVVDVVDPTV